MNQVIISGRRLELREIIKDDLPILLEWRNSEVFQKNCLAFRSVCTEEQLDQEITKAYSFDRYIQFIAWDKKNQPVGTNWIYRYSKQNGFAYTSTFISEPFRYHYFYGIEMFLLTCNYLFKVLGCRKVYSEIHANNSDSQGILKKIGLACEGFLVNHTCISEDMYTDLLIYALYREQFEQSNFTKRFI